MVSSRVASLFVLWIGVYFVLSLLVLIGANHALKKHGQRRGIKNGLLSPVLWPWPLRGVASLMLLLYCVIPNILILSCFIFGPFLAAAEGWGALIGIEYLLSSALALPVSLTNVMPETTGGLFIDAVISMWVMLIGAVCSGFVAQTVLITKLAELMPETCLGFYRFVFLYVPIFIFLVAVFSGGILAGIEGWSYSNGFFFIVGQASGAQIVAVSPRTVHGAVMTAIFDVVEFGIVGAIFGLVVSHPYAIKTSSKMEGTPPDPPPLEDMDLTELNKVFKEKQEAMKKEQEHMAQLQKHIENKNHKGEHEVGEHTIVIRGTIVTETEDINSRTVAILPNGTVVNVLEIRDLKADHRVRGRIEKPAGWISLRHTDDNYSWTVPKDVRRKAEEPPPQEPEKKDEPAPSPPDPKEELQRHKAKLMARIEQLEKAPSRTPPQHPSPSFFQCWGHHEEDHPDTEEDQVTVVVQSLSPPGILAGKTAVITGAGKGMGRAISLAYMKEGANLILSGHIQSELEDVAHECANLGPAYRVKVFPADLSKPKGVDDLADHVLRKSRGCDILVNGAGMTSCSDAVGELDGWDEMVYLNLSGVIRLTSRLAPSMVNKKAGVIINMGSTATVDSSSDSHAVFAASKDGLRSWSDSIFTGLQHDNIKVVLVNPSFVLDGDSKLLEAIPPEDVAEICLLPFKLPSGAVPSELSLRLSSRSQPET